MSPDGRGGGRDAIRHTMQAAERGHAGDAKTRSPTSVRPSSRAALNAARQSHGKTSSGQSRSLSPPRTARHSATATTNNEHPRQVIRVRRRPMSASQAKLKHVMMRAAFPHEFALSPSVALGLSTRNVVNISGPNRQPRHTDNDTSSLGATQRQTAQTLSTLHGFGYDMDADNNHWHAAAAAASLPQSPSSPPNVLKGNLPLDWSRWRHLQRGGSQSSTQERKERSDAFHIVGNAALLSPSCASVLSYVPPPSSSSRPLQELSHSMQSLSASSSDGRLALSRELASEPSMSAILEQLPLPTVSVTVLRSPRAARVAPAACTPSRGDAHLASGGGEGGGGGGGGVGRAAAVAARAGRRLREI